MSDAPERPAEYRPEEGAEVRPVSRYAANPRGLEAALVPDAPEMPYRSLSLLAFGAFVVALGYSFVIALGGIIAFWDAAPWVLVLGTILVPLLSLPIALKFDVRTPLGLLRFAGLALLVFYAVPVGVGGLVAFPSHTPWLLPPWTLAQPLLAGGCGWAARLRIQASENTLSGKALATWATGLSLFFALCYAAYYTATYIAVRQQGVQFADNWIDLLQKDDIERAFVLLVPANERPASDTLSRQDLELNYNLQPGSDGLGHFSSFAQRPEVRLLRGTSKANIELTAVRDWDYEAGGYQVRLSYRVTTPNWTFPLELTVHGLESKTGAYKGRRWNVQMGLSGVRVEPLVSADGARVRSLSASGYDFADAWTKLLYRNEPKAFAPPIAVRSEPKMFWTPTDSIRKGIVDRVNTMLTIGGEKPDKFAVRPSSWPSWSDEDGRLRFRYDATLEMEVPATSEKGVAGQSKVRVEARLIVSCPASAMTGGQPEWRVEALELLRGRRLDDGPPPKPRGR